MNKKQIYLLIVAGIGFLVCIAINFRDVISLYFSNVATGTAMVDPLPTLVELVIMTIIFGILFIKFKTPKKKG